MYRNALLFFMFFLVFSAKSQNIIYQHSPYHTFIENKGQWNKNVLFKNKIEQGNIWVEQGRILFQIQDYSALQKTHGHQKKIEEPLQFKQRLITLRFLGSQEVNNITRKGKSDYYYNYFIGNDSSKWASNVYTYSEFTLSNIYEGIDLHFIEEKRQIKYEFKVNPHINPNIIRLKYSYQKGLKIDRKGNLIIQTELGDIIEKKPTAYQIVNGKIIDIPCAFHLEDSVVTFQLGEYNKRATLIIDPTIVFATYDGSLSDNFGMTATYGYDGTAYCGGTVYGNAYPIPDSNVYDSQSNMTIANIGTVTTDCFIAKYSPDGSTMLWATYFGGGNNVDGTDAPHSLICDRNNDVYVFGSTSSQDFPTTVNAFKNKFSGGTPMKFIFNGVYFDKYGTDIFVAKFSSDGHQLLGSTYVGGEKNDGINYSVSAGDYGSAGAYDSLTSNYGDQFRGEIMLDKNLNVIVGSCTRSDSFPTKDAFQDTLRGQQEGVIFKLKSDFTQLLFSSYFGGTGNDAVYSVKVDSSDNIVFCGGTTSLDLDTTSGVYQTIYAGGEADGFIGKLTPDGKTVQHITYIGTPHYDQTFFVDIDRDNNIYVLGQSNGGVFPVINASYSNPGSCQFIAKFKPDLSGIIASTVFGSGKSTFDISPSAFMVDICGNLYVSGWGANLLKPITMSGMPITPDAYQPTTADGYDFYLIAIAHGFSSLLYGTYLGGNLSQEHVDGGTSRFDKNGVVYQAVCAGCHGNSDFPTTPNAWSSQNLAPNGCNALVFKFNFNLIPDAEFSVSKAEGCTPFTVHFQNNSSPSDSYYWEFGNGDIDSTTFNPIKTYSDTGTYEVWLHVTDSICLITDSMRITINVYKDLNIESISDISLCKTDTIVLRADANGTATKWVWSSNRNFTDTLNTTLKDSTVQINHPKDGYYYIKTINEGCSIIDSVKVSFVSSNLSLEAKSTKLCGGDPMDITAQSTNPSVTFSNFNWEMDSIIVSGEGTNKVTVEPYQTQFVYVSALSNNGCWIKDSILLTVSNIDPLKVNASVSREEVPVGDTVTLTATPSGYNYHWIPSQNLENPSHQTTVATVYSPTKYIVFISDGICTKYDSVFVKTYPYSCSEPYIFVPNAFTPNADGENDRVFVRSQVVSDITFRIYDRWGEKVYETYTMHDFWDGTYKGKPLAPDVYDYYLKGHCLDGQSFLIKGNITLIR